MSLTSLPKVKLSPEKDWVAKKRPIDSPLRNIILADVDELPPEEFLGRLAVWTRLLRWETSDE